MYSHSENSSGGCSILVHISDSNKITSESLGFPKSVLGQSTCLSDEIVNILSDFLKIIYVYSLVGICIDAD